jgi:hypothetical protein
MNESNNPNTYDNYLEDTESNSNERDDLDDYENAQDDVELNRAISKSRILNPMRPKPPVTINQEFFNKYSKMDLTSIVEKKGNLSYASWSAIWDIIMKDYPCSDYKVWFETLEDNSVMVYCDLMISDGDRSMKRFMWLPVMDNRNNSVIKPTSRNISDAYMRCLVKASAMAGLGLYIYKGEDIPSDDTPKTVDKISIEQAFVLSDFIEKAGSLIDKVEKAYKVKKLEEMSTSQYEDCMKLLVSKIKAKELSEKIKEEEDFNVA